MINGKVIAVVMPAYNAARTLETTAKELPDCVDLKILVDDNSKDETVAIAARLGLQVFAHEKNYGYGRNQQTCYREALASGADIGVMLHPDYQYTPELVAAIASMIAYDVYDVVLGSRILGGGSLTSVGRSSRHPNRDLRVCNSGSASRLFCTLEYPAEAGVRAGTARLDSAVGLGFCRKLKEARFRLSDKKDFVDGSGATPVGRVSRLDEKSFKFSSFCDC